MAGDAFKKVVAGEPFRPQASAWNAFIDAANYVKSQQSGGAGGDRSRASAPGVVAIRNDSGADRARFEILGLDGILFGPEDNLAEFVNHFAFKGVEPTAEHAGKWVVLLEPVLDGKIGRAMLCGPVAVKVQFDNEAAAYVDCIPEDCSKLLAGPVGAPVVWKEEGTGDKWAVILASPLPAGLQPLRVKFTADLATGSSALAHEMEWNESAWSEKDPAVEVTVHDDGLNDTAKSGQEGWVWRDRQADRYYVLRLEKTQTTVVTQLCCGEEEATVCDVSVWLEGNFTIDTECCAPPPEKEE